MLLFILKKKFQYLEVKNHTLTFSKLKKFNYKNNYNGEKNKIIKIPKIFSLIYFFSLTTFKAIKRNSKLI